jgi:hypothetical protein
LKTRKVSGEIIQLLSVHTTRIVENMKNKHGEESADTQPFPTNDGENTQATKRSHESEEFRVNGKDIS